MNEKPSHDSPPNPHTNESTPSTEVEVTQPSFGSFYYADVMDAKTIAWTFEYAREHPEDEYIEGKIESLWYTNEKVKRIKGRNMLGFDEEYFKERNFQLSPNNED